VPLIGLRLQVICSIMSARTKDNPLLCVLHQFRRQCAKRDAP
jgi:hypothetical protein